jgi:hypothetical protein
VLKRLSALVVSAKAKLFGSTPSGQLPDTRQEELAASDQLLAKLERRLTPKGLTPLLLRELGLTETTTRQSARQLPETGEAARTEVCPQKERGAL